VSPVDASGMAPLLEQCLLSLPPRSHRRRGQAKSDDDRRLIVLRRAGVWLGEGASVVGPPFAANRVTTSGESSERAGGNVGARSGMGAPGRSDGLV